MDDQTSDAQTDNIPPDDQLMFCVLNHMGNTVSCYVTDSSEKHILGVSAAEFTENKGTDKRNNRITAAASAGLQGINLLKNSGGESGIEYWSGCTSNTDLSNVYIGKQSFRITSATLSQTAALSAGETYTLSAYVKKASGAQARLCIRYGGQEVASSELLNYDASGVNDGWVRLSATLTPSVSDSYEAALIVNGTAYADALQFEKGDAPSAYNPVDDASFEWTNSSFSNTAWRKNGSSIISTSNGYFGTNVVTLKGDSGLQRAYQIIPLNVPLDSSFLFSAWAKGAADPGSVDQKAETDDSYFGIAIRLHFSDNTSEIHYKSFDPYCRDWQYIQDIVTPDKENNASGSITITQATIAVAYDNNINTAYVDNVSLRLGQAQTYAYDEEGNVDTATLTGGGAEGAEYDEDTGDLTKYTSPNGVVFNYTSNTQHSITKEVGAGTVTDYTYDTNGYLLSTTYSSDPEKDDPRYLTSSSEQTTDKNYTESVTDTAGNTTSYLYASGRLEKATDAAGTTTTYTYYHNNDRSKSTYITGIAAIDYTYDKGQLSQLKRKTFPYEGAPQSEAVYQSYNFDYNAWGQRTSVSVGNQILSTSEHEDVNSNAPGTGGGNKTKTTYGNGDSVSYVYDKLDRLIKTVYNDSGEYVEYTYNGEGSLSKLVHRLSDNDDDDSNDPVIASYEFERDNLDRLIRSRQVNSNNGTVQRTEHLYDAIGRLSTQRWTIGTQNYSESYTYNDGETGNGALNTVTLGTEDQVVFTYDPLNRLTEELVKSPNGNPLFKHAIAYTDLGNNQTTNLVKFYNVRYANNQLIAGNRYSYDSMGNISEIAQSTGNFFPLIAYDYDDQGQLISEEFYDGNGNGESHITDSYTYTYDTAGNILSVEDKYGETIKSYTYSTGDWKDLLTSVTVGNTTHTLQYDQSGNPTTYSNGEQLYTNLTWEHGRQLVSLITGGKTSTFDYDHEGIRTRKIYNHEYHNYITQGGKVVRETVQTPDWNWVLDFIYDNADRPFALKYSYDGGNSFETYYYILNYQGDVVALLDSNCKVVARYTYNAWGEILEATGEMAETNPLRYRGYYYDSETGFYYLQSRYYDPTIGRFINADELTCTGQGLLGNNMYSYCLNNPVSYSDASGKFALSAFLGAVVGGAIGGAIISTVSHVVNCAINGQELTASGLANAAITGAVTGAIGGAIGTISLATSVATVAVKGIASAAVGIGTGIKAGLEAEGSSYKKWATGITTGLITAGSTFLGSQIEAYDIASGFVGNVFTNFAATLFVGVPAEIVSVGAQQGINAVEEAVNSSSSSYSQSHYSARNAVLVRAIAY